MAKTKRNGKKVLAKKSARNVVAKAKAHRKQRVVAAPKRKRVKPLPMKKPVVVIAIEAEAKRSPAFAWAGMPIAIMKMWLAPFERRT
jgi:hypothetical protein